MQLCCTNTAERIEVLLGVETLGDPRNFVFDGSPDLPHRFNAAFVKLLWSLVLLITTLTSLLIEQRFNVPLDTL